MFHLRGNGFVRVPDAIVRVDGSSVPAGKLFAGGSTSSIDGLQVPLHQSGSEDGDVDTRRTRLVDRHSGGTLNVVHKGLDRRRTFSYLYFALLDATWSVTIMAIAICYLAFNFFFATLYLITHSFDEGANGHDPGFLTAFYFSIQTFDTIGYGKLLPEHNLGNWIVAVESFLGNLMLVFQTGLVFAKFSQPRALGHCIKFSDVATINKSNPCFEGSDTDGNYVSGAPSLAFRIVDLRPTSQILSSSFHLLCIKRLPCENGAEDIQIEEMDFELNRQRGRNRAIGMSAPLLNLPWTVVHKIDACSPLHGLSELRMKELKLELVAILDGTDESVSDNLQARWSYVTEEILRGFKFEPMVFPTQDADGRHLLLIDHNSFDALLAVNPVENEESNRGYHQG
ncbi:hypothetical protein CYMTET_20751 [Cymbomonas tetramitiformis]|uniref:Inward rectifier potassium channel C-terminal domain-containing protein n=1 Tax=Cymbomonas tetramitiformis TaxID=36881 RepID=A0AAE0L3K2_9CHLO|nr:hypothetical protein CYMTET_20751 [Cymbomonas tetramitiformis]|eukprot:gene13896-16423_t